jgi:hypothetical protein
VAAALELARAWTETGIAGRVSEVNLEDMRDVRVQLAGDDAHIEVRLGREKFATRFRQALEVFDAQRGTQRGPFITYVDVSQGKRAIVGTGATAHAPVESPAEATDGAQPSGAETVAEGSEQSQPVVLKAAAKKKTPEKKSSRTSREQEKKRTAVRPAGEAVRPRRVG